MAEDFQDGMCESKWWNTGRSTGWIAPPAEVSSVSMAASTVSCSYATDNIVAFGWSSGEIMESKARPTDNLMPSGAFMAGSSFSMAGSGLPPPPNWNQFLMSGDQRNSYDMLNEELSSRPYMGSDEVQLGEINQTLMLEQHHLRSGNEVPAGTAFLTTSTAYENPSSIFLQGLIDSAPQHACDRTNYDIGQNDKNHQSLAKFSQFLKNSLPSCEPSPKWSQNRNAIADPLSGFYPSSMHAPFLLQNFEEKPNNTSITTKQAKVEQAKHFHMGARKGANEPAFKKARAETPSPLPTFKVRKEKLSDRVTALQQLVSPFGKTDTASVLYEAIEYIKFLHDQVNVLSAPYLKNDHPIQPQQVCEKSTDGEAHKKDLRSKGLCLVPISSTFPVTNENIADFWTPTFGGSYR